MHRPSIAKVIKRLPRKGRAKRHQIKFYYFGDYLIAEVIKSLLTVLLVLALAGCGDTGHGEPSALSGLNQVPTQTDAVPTDTTSPEITPPGEFILINGGTFQMGSPESEPWHSEDETVHSVTLGGFYISRHKAAQAEYQAVMGESPSSFTGDDLPVEGVTDAISFYGAADDTNLQLKCGLPHFN